MPHVLPLLPPPCDCTHSLARHQTDETGPRIKEETPPRAPPQKRKVLGESSSLSTSVTAGPPQPKHIRPNGHAASSGSGVGVGVGIGVGVGVGIGVGVGVVVGGGGGGGASRGSNGVVGHHAASVVSTNHAPAAVPAAAHANGRATGAGVVANHSTPAATRCVSPSVRSRVPAAAPAAAAAAAAPAPAAPAAASSAAAVRQSAMQAPPVPVASGVDAVYMSQDDDADMYQHLEEHLEADPVMSGD